MGNDYEHSETQLEQALAMNRLLIDTLNKDRQERRKTRKISIICASICLVSVVLLVGVIVALASGVTVETVTTETTVTQDTGEGSGNNVFQAGEYSSYSEGGVE